MPKHTVGLRAANLGAAVLDAVQIDVELVSGWKAAAIVGTTCALPQRVEVAEGEVRIMGSKSRLLQALVAGSGVNSVPTQGLNWRKGWA